MATLYLISVIITNAFGILNRKAYDLLTVIVFSFIPVINIIWVMIEAFELFKKNKIKQRILNAIFLNKNREKVIKEIIKNNEDIKLINEYNVKFALNIIDELILKKHFKEQSGGIPFDSIIGEISFIELMIDYRNYGILKKTTKRLKELELLNKKLKGNKNILKLDYNALRDMFMIKIKIFVNENTYFDYELFLNADSICQFVEKE